MKASCLGKTLGTWRVWPAHRDVLKKWSSCVSFFFFFFFSFFYSNGSPTWLCCETSFSHSCLFRQTAQVAAGLAATGSTTLGSRYSWSGEQAPAKPCVQEWSHLPVPAVLLHPAMHMLYSLKWELCFCSFLLSVVQWFTVVLKWFLCFSMPRLSSHTLFISLFCLILYLRLLFFPLGAFTVIKFQFWRIL